MKSKTPLNLGFSLTLAMLVAGCGRQGEGERCDTANGDDDCDSGLRCVSSSELSQVEEGALCCPPADQTPSVDACNADIPLFDEDDDEQTDDQSSDEQGQEDGQDAAQDTPADDVADAG